MTVPPSTAERFAIIPLPPGPAPADAIITGSMSAVMENIVDSHARADAIEQAARAVEDAVEAQELAAEAERLQEMAKANTVQMITDTIDRVTSRLDAYIARRDAEEEEAEAQRIEAQLAALPDPDDPATHVPGGELHTLAAKQEPETDDMGGVSLSYRSIPTSYVRAGPKDQAEFEEPTDPTGTAIPPATALEFDEV